MRACLTGVTASRGVPNAADARAFTSQTASTPPLVATTSSSPVRPERQLRSSTRQPRSAYHAAARSSPDAPRARPVTRGGPGRAAPREDGRRSSSAASAARAPAAGRHGEPPSQPPVARRPSQLLLGELLHVHVLEGDDLHGRHEPGLAVHVPHPRVAQLELDPAATAVVVDPLLDLVGEVETPLGLHHVGEHGRDVLVLLVELELDLRLVALEILGRHPSDGTP